MPKKPARTPINVLYDKIARVQITLTEVMDAIAELDARFTPPVETSAPFTTGKPKAKKIRAAAAR